MELQLKTFTNLSVLEQARNTAKEQLVEKYETSVTHFIRIIQQVMKANSLGHFEAMKMIQDKTDLSDEPQNKIMFAAALMEIVEEFNLKG